MTGRVLSRPAGLRLDLNGVVKGLAVDEGLGLLEGPGVVAAGGDVATRGPAVVGLPSGGEVRLLRGGLATSGNTGRRWQRGGVSQHHLIDPSTGRPARSRWSLVTVAAADCVAADVAAKAAFLLSDDGPAWLEERGLPGRFVGGGRVLTTPLWRGASERAGIAA
jgi:thiamine biosynthesis lipoprotein